MPYFFVTVFHARNIFHIYGEAVFYSNDGICYLLYILVLAGGPDNKFFSAFDEMSTGDVSILFPDGIDEIIDGEVVGL